MPFSGPEPLVRTTFIEGNPVISPGGRYLAYQSNASGQDQIYVRPFPRVNDGWWQVSTNGGRIPQWVPNGRELLYLDADNRLTAVPVQTAGSTFVHGTPAKVFETILPEPIGFSNRSYAVSPDGQRFLMIKESTAERTDVATTGMVVVLNWFEELKAKVSR